nr:reverse transcriptase domain-containing protein [Tanacetum cinerariifolium]
MVAKGPGDLPVPDLRTMEELCQPSLNGRGGPIAPIAIQTTNFGLKNDMIQQVQNSCQFHGLPVKHETEAIKDMMHPTNNESTKDVQPSVVQSESPILDSKLINSPIIEPVAFPDLNFNIRFVDDLILMPKFGPFIKSLLTNKDKLCELARTPLNEHRSTVLLKRLPEKLGDPRKFLISCDFPRMAECLALADLGANINLMPLSVWNKLSLPDLSPTYMTLELTGNGYSRNRQKPSQKRQN